jgi:hypothetical protein
MIKNITIVILYLIVFFIWMQFARECLLVGFNWMPEGLGSLH